MNQSEYISHNLNAHDDIKIISLMEAFGAAGYGIYWVLVEVMSREEKRRLPLKPFTTTAIARKCNEPNDKVQQVINTCINQLELFIMEENCFYSQSLRDRLQLRDEAYDKKRRAGKSGADKRWHKNGDAIADDSTAIAENGNSCQIESEIEIRSENGELGSEKGESETTSTPVGDSKKNNQGALKLNGKSKPEKSNRGPARKSSAHLFSESPYHELDMFRLAPPFCKPEFEINYPHIDLEYYHKQLIRFTSGDPPKRKTDWIAYIEGWMSEDKSNNKLVTTKRNGTANKSSRGVPTSSTSISDALRANRHQQRAGTQG